MLQKALKGAAVAGASAALAVGMASPAMAGGSDYVYDPDDFGGVNLLSNFCLDAHDIVQLVNLDILNSDGNTCDFVDSEVHANGNDVDLDEGHHHWDD